MKIVSGKENFVLDKPSAVVLGKFDGIHLGHNLLLEKLAEKKKSGLQTVVFTFDKSPAALFLKNGESYREICVGEEKREIFSAFHEKQDENGIDVLIEFPMNARTVSIPAEKFITEILQKQLKCKTLIAGDDITFGHKGLGNREMLQKFSASGAFTLELVDKLQVQRVCPDMNLKEEISSTLIRKLINEGKIAEAERLLGRPFSLTGEVVHGRKLAGGILNMPTANVLWPEHKVLPAFGVYLTLVSFENHVFKAITNVGTKPTIDGTEVLAESYLYDFSGDLYGKHIKIAFMQFLRPEVRFESLDALKKQMQSDMEKGRKMWN